MLSESQLGNFKKSIHNGNYYKGNTFESLMYLKCQYTKCFFFFFPSISLVQNTKWLEPDSNRDSLKWSSVPNLKPTLFFMYLLIHFMFVQLWIGNTAECRFDFAEIWSIIIIDSVLDILIIHKKISKIFKIISDSTHRVIHIVMASRAPK